MKVSVIMTVRNGMPFLKDSVESVLLQSYTDFELIIVDDGSNDGSINYLQSLSEQDSRVHVLITGRVGRAAALNLALNKAEGELVANIDADDYWHERKLELQTQIFAEGFNGLLGTGSQIIFGGQAPLFQATNGLPLVVEDVAIKLLTSNPICHSSILAPRSLLVAVGGYNEALSKLVDYDLWARLYESNSSIALLRLPLVCKRVHVGQSFENKKRLSYLWADYMLRRALIKKMGGSTKYSVLNLIKLIYGLLPQRLRMMLRMRQRPSQVA